MVENGATLRGPPTSPSLLERMRDKAPDAWREFDLFHRDMILHWARRFGCPAEYCEDVCQESMVALLRALPGFRLGSRPGSFHAFLRRIVQRRTVDLLRRIGRTPVGVDEDAAGLAEDRHASPVSVGTATDECLWLRTLVRRACHTVFEDISESAYKAFCLYAVDGIEVGEVCRRLGLSNSAAVYQHKSRVLRAVRDAMRTLLDAFDDPELHAGAGRLTGREALAMIAAVLREMPDLRLTQAVDTVAVDRVRSVRRALELCEARTDPPWLVIPKTGLIQSLASRRKLSVGNRGADVTLSEPGISGIHAEIVRADDVMEDSWTVCDLASRNGVLVNARRVENRALRDGDVIALGRAVLVFLER